MKQEGRTDQELIESYCFLFPDKSKLQWICEKGLSVGQCKITTLGNPSQGVYLSKHSDLLQINPFEVGSSGDIIIFKVMRGRIKHINENMPKNAMEATPKFDCHLSRSATRVSSLLSYRAFELTQQYFFEFVFNEIKARPRHVCPYAVVSFHYKGKETAGTPLTAHRFNTISPEGRRGKSSYTVWSGLLVNKGQELFPICLESSSRPYLPLKLPEKLEVSQAMPLEQVKRKFPPVVFSWDTYSISREVMKFQMSCSLFELVAGKGKPTSGSLAALINKLEKDRMVLVKPWFDKGFLFLLTSTQMERRGWAEKSLKALFIFQESRTVVKYASRLFEPEPLLVEPQTAIQPAVEPFLPALHYALFKLRPHPGKDLSLGVGRQATDYLTRMDSGMVRPFILPDYKYNVDERTNPQPVPRHKFNMEAVLRSYIHSPLNYLLPVNKAKDIIERIRSPVPVAAPMPAASAAAPVEYSPVSDWGGSDRGSDRVEKPPEKPLQERPPTTMSVLENLPKDGRLRPSPAHSNGAQLQHKAHIESPAEPSRSQLSQNEYDKDKMKQLLKLIQLHKKALVKDPGKEQGEDGAWDLNSLKRKFEGYEKGGMSKRQCADQQSNGEPSRGGALGDDFGDEAAQNDNLTAVMESMGFYDTDLRACSNANATTANDTQRLLKILLSTLNKAVAQGSLSGLTNYGESSTGSGSTDQNFSDPELRKASEALHTNYVEEDMDCSPGSPFSPGSTTELPQPSDSLLKDNSVCEDKAQLHLKPEPMEATVTECEPELSAVVDGKKAPVLMLPAAEESSFRSAISLDTILNQEVHSLTSDIRNMMQTQRICYSSQLPPRLPPRRCWRPNSCFSHYVVPYVSTVPVQGHVQVLCEKMEGLIPAPPAPSKNETQPAVTTSCLISPPHTTVHTLKAEAEPPQSQSPAFTHSSRTGFIKETPPCKTETSSAEDARDVYSPSHVTPDSPEQDPKNTETSSEGGPSLLAGSLISQLKPEVFSSLVEIFKDVTKNTVKFYIYSGDEGEESTVCKEIKGYLKSLGNSECSPHTFLENSGSLDKLLIIIQNEDIAAHVHKIPALVSLKKLPAVSFAGVDTLDDVKNHTYNELFVSGGFMVSDEFVLNPDFITQDRLQALLKFLEEQSSPEHPWQWKVHCKSHKKLKELGRLNPNAMGLLNLLTLYQKKHLVEFLPYHECDTQSRQAPDLECLIKLQAQHTQQRHLIFLTERPFEMFLQFSRNGIVIASIDDVMSGFHSLIGSINQNELPTPPSTVNDECVEAEDMSLDSDDGEPANISDTAEQNQPLEKEKNPQPPPPKREEFRPPLPEHQTTPDRTPTLSDLSALKSAISQFKAANHVGSSDIGSLSPGGFPVNPHQSFLCPSATWSSYTGSSSYTVSPAYPASPCSATQEPEYRPPGPVSAAPATPILPSAGPLANLASLPLEVKPPPPPHLMVLGHKYGSDTGGAGATGASSFNSMSTPTHPQTDPSDSAQPGFTAETPTRQEQTLGGTGEGVWGQGTPPTVTVTTGTGNLSSSGEALLSSAPGNTGDRTQVNSVDTHKASVGVPKMATRGGSVHRPKLPPHPVSGTGFHSFGATHGQMHRGPMQGGMGPGSLGNFRGRGAPPVGHRPRPPGRGHERGGRGGPCSWGYPPGRGGPPNYYTNYSYSHNYSPE
ncbi:protein TASOR isoform X2 [Gouania willdenowi]|nr:protein TASOR-like isoform X2 [Gouania willdenowi]XP_028308047.1 protein TASOR-like isoform X2 [Gouania willdenowi]